MDALRATPPLALPRELRWCLSLNRWGARPAALRFFGAVSRLGDGAAWYALIALLPLAFGPSAAAASLHLGLAALVNVALYRTLKGWTRRPRPFRRLGAIKAHVAPLDEFSFPSGHTLHAVTLTLIACWYFPVLAVVLVPFALAVAASRVVLGLHYPSDVLAATLIGLGIAWCSIELATTTGVAAVALGAG
jgi:undecaprenyl-diphosphatase